MNIKKSCFTFDLLLMFVESLASGASILIILLFYLFFPTIVACKISLLSSVHTTRFRSTQVCSVDFITLLYSDQYRSISIQHIHHLCLFFLHYWYSLHLASHQGKKSGGSFPSRSEHLCIIYMIKPYDRTKD